MKKMSDYDKIMQVIEAVGVKISKAESMCGFGGGTLSKLKDRKGGEGSLHPDNAQKFLRTFKVNPKWWANGQGETFLPELSEESKINDAGTLKGRIPAPDMYQVVVDTMQHILNQNTKLMESREADIQKLHVDKEKIYKEKEWMYAHIDELTSKISGPQELKK